MDYIERTILKLNREFGKDELVASLNKKLSDKNIEIGKLNSEISHLEYENGILNENNKSLNELILENKKLKEENQSLRQKNKNLYNIFKKIDKKSKFSLENTPTYIKLKENNLRLNRLVNEKSKTIKDLIKQLGDLYDKLNN